MIEGRRRGGGWMLATALGLGCATPRVDPPRTPAPADPPAEREAAAAEPRASATEPPAGMVYVPAGIVHLPCDGESLCETAVEAFFIDRTEVTLSAYEQCVDAGACRPIEHRSSTCSYVYEPELVDRGQRPATCVETDEPRAFCAWRGARLPSAAQWVRAAFGDQRDRSYPWGDAPPSCEVANLCQSSDLRPDPVGSHPQDESPFGVLDLGGSVMERVAEGQWYGRAWDWIHGSVPEQPRSFRRWSTTGRMVYGNAGFRCAAPAP